MPTRSKMKSRIRSGKTRKNRGSNPMSFEKEIVLTFLQMLNTVKLYHWKTRSYATHKATDGLYSDLNDSIDKFVEILLGKYGDRVNLTGVKSIPLCDFSTQEQFKEKIMSYKMFLVKLDENPAMHQMTNSDLYNIRDEMLGQFNQLLYLLTFK